MDGKIFDLIEANRGSDGEMLPVEKEALMEALMEIPHDVALEYSDGLGCYIEGLIVLKNIVASSDKPHLIKHLVDGLNENQLERLRVIIKFLPGLVEEKGLDKIVNATLGISQPDEESQEKAQELISMVQCISMNHSEIAKVFANEGRLLKLFCDTIILCGMGDDVASQMRNRLSMAPKSDLNWLLDFTKKLLM